MPGKGRRSVVRSARCRAIDSRNSGTPDGRAPSHGRTRGRDEGGLDVDADRCYGCGLCANACPTGCVTMRRRP
ncbi:MAG: 4Fe-4S binding protein [Candidatus Eisenbacteria bacterium]|nr:4Fe-4S binding protein [Candidatus Eisenbacteria bacterium]